MTDKEKELHNPGKTEIPTVLKEVTNETNIRAGFVLNPEKEKELIKSVIDKIQALNPDAEILCMENIIFCDSPEKLELPEGFYFSDINGITNKNIEQSGVFVSITIYPQRHRPDFNKKKEE